MLYVYRGLPGSGKSTAAKKLGCLHTEADMFFTRNGVYQYNKSHIEQAHNFCFSFVKDALHRGLDVVVSNVFAKAWMIDKYVREARLQGAEYKVVTFCAKFGSVHNVPREAMEKFAAQWETYPNEEIYMYDAGSCGGKD